MNATAIETRWAAKTGAATTEIALAAVASIGAAAPTIIAIDVTIGDATGMIAKAIAANGSPIVASIIGMEMATAAGRADIAVTVEATDAGLITVTADSTAAASHIAAAEIGIGMMRGVAVGMTEGDPSLGGNVGGTTASRTAGLDITALHRTALGITVGGTANAGSREVSVIASPIAGQGLSNARARR